MSDLFLGVDVGTGSVRAGLFDSSGRLLNVSVKNIKINNPQAGYYEQSSDDVWASVGYTVKEVAAKVEDKARIKGISFCATCSLVAIGENDEPISVNKNWNIVMWMDHRAQEEADYINSTNHPVLKYVGGSISLEMETPKLLWLRKNMRNQYDATKKFFDLGDFLRWKATGSQKRSVCCLVCKWTLLNSPKEGSEWDKTYFQLIGLSDALPKIGDTLSYPGDSDVISATAADYLELERSTVVGFSMIDAHSGVLGMLGCKNRDYRIPNQINELQIDASTRLSIICGTSNCHMALSKQSHLVPGVWGPYYGVILKDFYLSEGGQSAAGKLLDHVVSSHPAYGPMLQQLGDHGMVLTHLEEILPSIATDRKLISQLTQDVHVWPDFHGNRSPLADPTLKGMLSGLTLSTTVESLAILYLATIQSLAYGSRHILEAMEKSGHKFEELVICGGLTKSKLFLQMHADVLQLPVLVPDCREPVILGAAMSAAAAASSEDLNKIMDRMAGTCKAILPNIEDRSYHNRKFAVFLKMLEDQRSYKKLMERHLAERDWCKKSFED